MKYFPRQWEETNICLWNKDVHSSLLTGVLSYPRSIERAIFILNQFLEDLVIHHQHLCISYYHPFGQWFPATEFAINLYSYLWIWCPERWWTYVCFKTSNVGVQVAHDHIEDAIRGALSLMKSLYLNLGLRIRDNVC